jgi:hypothetical protein
MHDIRAISLIASYCLYSIVFEYSVLAHSVANLVASGSVWKAYQSFCSLQIGLNDRPFRLSFRFYRHGPQIDRNIGNNVAYAPPLHLDHRIVSARGA